MAVLVGAVALEVFVGSMGSGPIMARLLSNSIFWVVIALPVLGVGLGLFAATTRQEDLTRTGARYGRAKVDIVTARQRAQLYRAVVRGAPDAMLIVGTGGGIAEANSAAQRVFERSRDQLLRSQVTDLIPGIDELGEGDRIERRNLAGEVLGSEWHTLGRHQDGTVFALDLQRTNIQDPMLDLLVVREATTRINDEKKMVREAIEAEHSRTADWGKARAKYLNRMCRRLETKLRAVIDLSDGVMEPVEGNIEDTIRDAASDLLVVVDKLLNLSMADDSLQELVLEPVAVVGLVEELSHQLDPVMRRNSNVLEVTIAPDVAILTTDRQKLSHALRNLLTNAAQYTRDGTVTLEVMMEPGRDTDWVAIYVSDTGVGLSANELNHLFKAFAITDAANSQDLLGVGIGLALSQHCARLLGGHIAVRSSQGEGSTFTLRIPFRGGRATPAPARPRVSTRENLGAAGSSTTPDGSPSTS